jgi:hypothetical protein
MRLIVNKLDSLHVVFIIQYNAHAHQMSFTVLSEALKIRINYTWGRLAEQRNS